VAGAASSPTVTAAAVRRARFFTEGFEHSFTSHAGAGWALSSWAAVQQAARDALAKLESGEAAPRDWTATNESPA
jgi:hypothetical protein